jgi:hypothetical protein
VSWLGELSAALAALDNPLTDRLAAELVDLVGSLGPNGEPVFPIVLADASFDFGSEEALALLSQGGIPVDEVPDLCNLGGFVEDFLHSDVVADLIEHVLPNQDHLPVVFAKEFSLEFVL